MRKVVTAITLLLATTVSAGSTQGTGARGTIRSRFDAVGQWGGLMSSTAGGGTNGCTAVITVWGERLAMDYPSGDQGCPRRGAWISDFAEQKTYRLLPDTHEYTVQSFSEVRRRIASNHESAAQSAPLMAQALPTTGVDLPAQSRGRAKRFEYGVALRETGQRLSLLGYDSREVVLTVTAVETGKTLEVDGGWVVTNTLWVGPRIASVDHLVAAMRRYASSVTKGVYDNPFTEIDFPMGGEFFDPFNPEHAVVGSHVVAEIDKLDGTVLSCISVYEIERTAKEWKNAQDQYEAQQRRLMSAGARVIGGSPPKRSRIITLQREFLSVQSTVTEADVLIPAGYHKK